MGRSVTLGTMIHDAHPTRPVRPHSAAADALLGRYFPVLDHGFVALVDYMGNDQAIEQAARVSFGPQARKLSDTRYLLRYLRRHMHTTPLEMVEIKFHCAMPMFVARQWIRHRTANVNEFSARYSEVPDLFYVPDHDQVCAQSSANKQGSAEPIDREAYETAVHAWQGDGAAARETYDMLLRNGVSRETSRIGLPLSTYTQWYWKCDLHNLLHFLGLRCDEHAQWEIRQYANIMAGMAQAVAPLAFEAWVDYAFTGVRFGREEIEALNAYRSGDDVRRYEITDEWPSREALEFEKKLKPKDVPNFSLCIENSFDYSHFADKWTVKK